MINNNKYSKKSTFTFSHSFEGHWLFIYFLFFLYRPQVVILKKSCRLLIGLGKMAKKKKKHWYDKWQRKSTPHILLDLKNEYNITTSKSSLKTLN